MSADTFWSPLRESQYRRYWLSFTMMAFGAGVSSAALPLTAVLTLDAGVLPAALLNALGWAPSLLFSLAIGAWADRTGRKRTTMIWSNLCSSVVLATVCVSHAIGVLSLFQLYLVVLLCGVLSVIFIVCDAKVFASLLTPADYLKGQSLLFGSAAVASLAGPALGGFLINMCTPPWVVLIDAAAFLCSAVLLIGIRAADPATPDIAEERGSVLAGLRFIRQEPFMNRALGTVATGNLFFEMFQAVVFVFLTVTLGATPQVVGLLLACQAAGALSGAVLASTVARRIGVGRTLLVGSITASVPIFMLLAANSPYDGTAVLLVSAFGCSGFGRALQNISVATVFSATVPDALRARARGAFQTVSTGTRTIGALLGGVVGTSIGLRPTLGVAALGGSLAWLWLVRSSLLRLHDAEPKIASSP